MRSSVVVALSVLACSAAALHTSSAATTTTTLNPMPRVTKAQYAEAQDFSSMADLYEALALTQTNAYNFLLNDKTGDLYLDLVVFLNYTLYSKSVLDYNNTHSMYVWVTLIPPTESRDGYCSIPRDSPLTPWNETSYFNTSMGVEGCNDYEAWSTVLGLLGQQFPNLVAVNIDDFVDNLESTFTAENVASMRAKLNTGGVRLWPTFYYHEYSTSKEIVFKQRPWLVGATDGIMFYFRNDKAGQDMCRNDASCDPLSTCVMPCLYQNCSNPSIPNFKGELMDFYQAVEDYKTPIVVGLYFSAYHSCPGGPSVYYDYTLLQQTLTSEMAVGAMVYVMQWFPDGKVNCPQSEEENEKDGMMVWDIGGRSRDIPSTKVCAVLRNFEKFD